METLSPFDRRVLAAYLEAPANLPGRAQRTVRALGMPLTAATLSRVLRSLVRLERAARATAQ